MSEFATKLREYREKANLKQSQLARKVGISGSYVSRLEANDRDPPRREVILDIGKELGLSFDERNTLLTLAGYTPIDLEDIKQEHPTMKLLADILEDERVPQDEKKLIGQYLQQIQKRWREQK